MNRIWIPDGEACKVEWYLSGGKAAGVTSVTDEWIPHEVGETRQVGFERVDPPRDLPSDWPLEPDEDRR